jgi:hypothetical protein
MHSNGLVICDTAGFGETRGATKDVFTFLSVQMIIKASKSIKAVIAVVEESQLYGNGRGIAFK